MFSRPLRLVTVALALVLVACGGGSATPTASKTPLLPLATAPSFSASSSSSPSSAASSQTPFGNFYPEFPATGLKVTETFSPRLQSRIPVRMYNVSNHPLRQDAVQAIYSVIDQLSLTELDLPGLDKDGKTSIVGQPRQPRGITMVIIPEGATKPRSTVSDFLRSRNPSAASAFGNAGDVFSYVQLNPGDFAGGAYSDYANLGLAVEACQELIEAVVLGPDQQPLDDPDAQQDAQEFLCNSVGGAVAARSLGLSYADYEKYARTHAIRTNRGLVPGIELDEEPYNSYPSLGSVVQ